MLQLHGTSGYDSKTISLFFRELIQNSVDAVRQQKSNLSVKPEGISAVIGDIKNIFGKKENPAETYKPQVNVFVDPSKRWMAIEDNGIGMDENTIIKGFLTLGGSMKGETASSGALGLAKGAFISGSKRIFVSTIHDGIKYEFLVDSLKLKADPKTKIKIDSSKAKGQPNGTIVAIELLDVPSFARSAEEWGNHDFPYLENIPVNFFNTNLNENFENIPAEIANYKATSSDKPTPFFKKIKTQGPSIINDRMHFDNWGEVEIIISKEKTSFGKHQVLSNGIFQFTETIRDSQNKPLPYNILINIKPNIKADNPNYPFNNTRDGIRPSVKDDYKKVIDRVQQHVNKIEDERVLKELEGLVPLEQVSIAEKYEKIKNEQTKPRVFFDDETDANIQEEIEETKYNNLNIQPGKPVLNNRTTLDFNGIEEDSMILLSKLSAISEHVRTHMIELGLSSGDSDFINLALALKKYQVGILIAKNIHGVNYKGRFNAV
ncbi:MAG: ATP-binding protein, partial [Bdellovibrio sp.]